MTLTKKETKTYTCKTPGITGELYLLISGDLFELSCYPTTVGIEHVSKDNTVTVCGTKYSTTNDGKASCAGPLSALIELVGAAKGDLSPAKELCPQHGPSCPAGDK